MMERIFFSRFLTAAAIACLIASCSDKGEPAGPGVPDGPDQPAAAASIEIDLLGSDEHSLSVRFSPGEHTVRYRYAIAGAQDKEAFEGGTLAGIVAVEGAERADVTFDSLTDDTRYTVYASAENIEGAACGTVTLDVTTPAGKSAVDMALEDNAGTSVTVNFVPNEYTAAYRYAIGAPADRDAFASGALEGISEAAARASVRFGDLVPLSDYVVFAQAVGRKGDAGEVQTLPVTTVDAPYMYVDFERFNCVCAVGTMRFSALCTGAEGFVCSREEFAEKLQPYGGDTAAMMQGLQWRDPSEKTFEALGRSCVPGESKFVAAAAFWTGAQQWAGWQVREFTAPPADASLALPGKPGVEYMPAGMVLIIRLTGDQNTAGMKAVHLRRSEWNAMGDDGVAALLDEAPMGWSTLAYTGIYTTDLDDNVCTFARAYNANGVEGCSPETYFYEYSLQRGEQENAAARPNRKF